MLSPTAPEPEPSRNQWFGTFPETFPEPVVRKPPRHRPGTYIGKDPIAKAVGEYCFQQQSIVGLALVKPVGLDSGHLQQTLICLNLERQIRISQASNFFNACCFQHVHCCTPVAFCLPSLVRSFVKRLWALKKVALGPD